MTLPTQIKLPSVQRRQLESPSDYLKYFEEMTYTLEEMYQDLAQAVNGDIFSDTFAGSEQWTPVVADTANSGTTFTYDHQTGWALRQGIITDCWFDVEWTANSGAITGNMYVLLPYKVAASNDMPFVGVCQPDTFTFTAGTDCVLNAIPDTYRCEIWNTISGATTANQGSVAAGRLIGHIRYIGQEIERA